MTDTPATAPGSTPAGGSPAPVSLREFARLVPMPYSTAREWTQRTPRRRPLIRVHSRNATGRMFIQLDQLPAVRAAYFGTTLATEQHAYRSVTTAPAPAPEAAP